MFHELTTNVSDDPFRSWPKSIHPEDYDRVMSEYKDAFNSNSQVSIEFRADTPGEYDSAAWRLFIMHPIDDGKPEAEPKHGYICAIIDITYVYG